MVTDCRGQHQILLPVREINLKPCTPTMLTQIICLDLAYQPRPTSVQFRDFLTGLNDEVNVGNLKVSALKRRR